MRAVFAFFAAALSLLSFGQGPQKVTFEAKLRDASVQAGQQTQILLTAHIAPSWHMFGSAKEGDWVNVKLSLPEGSAFEESAPQVEPPADIRNVPGFDKPGAFLEGDVVLALPVKLKADAKSGKGAITIRFQACDASSCLPPKSEDIPFDYTVSPGTAAAAGPVTDVPAQPAASVHTEAPAAASGVTDQTTAQIKAAQDSGLVSFFLLALGAGFLALLTPCVWPMIPVTVSFFSKTVAVDGKPNLRAALAYCLGIIGTFVGLGVVVTVLFGAAGIQRIAAHPLVNLGLGLLFVFLALNLFGVVELTLPAGIVGRFQKGTGANGLLGPVLMGLTFSLTSFTCTVPFVGTLLASSAKGGLLYPVVGMFGFSLAFALPFFGLALFPGYLAKLPRSGDWLVTVKAYMGFLELAAALKFFSNLDVTWNSSHPLGILPQEVFLAVWFAIFIGAALYLLGGLKLPHDGTPKIGLLRRGFGLVNTAIALYLLAALAGHAQLGSLTAFLPAYSVGHSSESASIRWESTIESGTKSADKDGKLIFINFTGQTCSNCRVMEKTVFPRPEIASLINQMTPVELYTDRDSESDRKNAQLREELTQTSTNPVYVIMTKDRKVLSVFQGGTSAAEFQAFLESGLAKK